MTHGYLLTEKRAGLWSSIFSREQLLATGAAAGVGVLAGLFMAHVKLGLGLPGHKQFIWMIPVIIARITGKGKFGTTAGSLSAAFTTLAWGGNLAGGAFLLPLIGVAGIVLDTTIIFIENHKIPPLLAIPFITFTGIFANLICFIKRFAAPAGGHSHNFLGIASPLFDILSYAFFGLLAGLVGSVIAYSILRIHPKK